MKLVLHDIKSELMKPFSDPRNPYIAPSPEELFEILTGENEYSLKYGQLITARVTGITSTRVFCRLDSGLEAIIEKENLSSDYGDVEDKVFPGMVIHARVLEVKKTLQTNGQPDFTVMLTSKSSDLARTKWDNGSFRDKDIYLIEDEFDLDQELKKTKKTKRPKFINRLIVHPQFQNISSKDAEKYLADKDIGEAIIRPSSKGNDHLTLTWKFYNNIYIHIDITERDKPNQLSLGKSLCIGSEKFEDINEIITRYVEPMGGYVKEMIEFRNFSPITLEEIDQKLKEEKQRQPQRIPYYIVISKEFPGRFVLAYNPNRPRHEYITVTPTGFRYRKQVLKNPEKLVGYLKSHYKT